MKIILTLLMLTSTLWSDFKLVTCNKGDIKQIVTEFGIDTESISKHQSKISFIVRDEIYEKIILKYNLEVVYNNYQEKLTYKGKDVKHLLNNGFELGSYGAGYFTLDELYDKARFLKDEFGDFARIDTIGNSLENNPIVSLSIGNLATENAILFSSMHHAREPGSASTPLYFFYEILNLYKENNKEILQLLEDTKIRWIICLNPDGYLHNINTNPNGGGLWRKNRSRNNFGIVQGVDLNRNYGLLEYWNANKGGSSSNPEASTYRGSSHFSEPETQVIRNLLDSERYKIALNFHSFVNSVIFPSTLERTQVADSVAFKSLFSHTRNYNGFVYGVDTLSIGYLMRGSSDEFMYHSHSILAVTPEIGDVFDGFYANNPETILSNCKKSYPMILNAWRSLNDNLVIITDSLLVDKNQSGKIEIIIQNIGLEASDPYEIVIRRESGDQSYNLKSLAPSEKYILEVSKDDFFIEDFQIEILGTVKQISKEFTAFYFPNRNDEYQLVENECFKLNDNIISDWSLLYRNNSECASFLTFDNPEADNVLLTFEARYSIEMNFDMATIEISDDGENWSYLPLKNSRKSIEMVPSNPDLEIEGYHGHETDYFNEVFDISDYDSEQIFLRIAMYSDGAIQYQGLTIKDLSLFYLDNNELNVESEDSNESIFKNDILRIPGYSGLVTISDNQGKQLSEFFYHKEKLLQLDKGFYLIRTKSQTYKILVY